VYRLGGLEAVITDLGVLEFAAGRGRLELGSVHPGVTLEQIQERTGFPLHAPVPVPVTEPPTPEELALLRGPVRQELEAFYPEFVRQQA
jgi:glutaconate CoA-transferase subunit B